MSPPRILIAASGTGGHLFPALYVALAMRAEDSSVIVEFIGSGRPLEEKVIDSAGFHRHVMLLGGLRRLGVVGLFRWLRGFPAAFVRCYGIISTFQPHVLVGVGGYVSFLPVLVATIRGVPTWIHEAEHEPGWTNRILGLIATRISVAYRDTKFFRRRVVLHTGHPLKPTMKPERFHRTISAPVRNVLVVGGSQGAQAIDHGASKLAKYFQEQNFSILHQCRPENERIVREAYQSAQVDARVVQFIEIMEEAYEWCDIVLSRTGAGIAREILVTGRPCICVPLPAAVEQMNNATELVRSGQGIIVEEGEQFSERLEDAFRRLSSRPLQNRVRTSETDDSAAAGKIAQGVIHLARSRV